LLTKNFKNFKVKATGEASSPQKGTFSTSKQYSSSLFLFVVGHFCPPGSGFGSIRIRIHITAKRLCSSSGSGIRIRNEDDILNFVEFGSSPIPASLNRQSFYLPYRENIYEERAHFCSMSGEITIKESLSRNRRLAE
jgi:hypothetical protein